MFVNKITAATLQALLIHRLHPLCIIISLAVVSVSIGIGEIIILLFSSPSPQNPQIPLTIAPIYVIIHLYTYFLYQGDPQKS